MNTTLDYTSMSDDELDVVISDLLDQGYTESQINTQLWGATTDDPDDTTNIQWTNFLADTDEKIQNLAEGGETRVGDFIYGQEDIFNPTKQVDKSLTLPGYKKATNTLVYYPFNPGRNKGIATQLGLSEDQLTPENYEKALSQLGLEKHLTKGEGGEMFEQWKKYDSVDPQTITEDEYNRTNASYEGDEIVGYKNGMSFDEYADKWNVKIGEVISPWDPKLSSREKKLKLKVQNSLKEIGNINEDNEDFLNYVTDIAPNKLEKLFFDVIKQTAQFEGKSLDEDSSIEDVQALDSTERDKALRNMFGEEKGNEMIQYLNENPQAYLDMIDADPINKLNEGFRNLSNELGDGSGEGLTVFGKQVTPTSIERNNTNAFLEQMGVTENIQAQIYGGTFDLPDARKAGFTSNYLDWLESAGGDQERYQLLNEYKEARVNKFLDDNDLGGKFRMNFGDDPEDFQQVSVRDRDGSWVYGYGSEAIRFTSPENEKIYQQNKKTQEEFLNHANAMGYTGFARDVSSSLTLRVGEPITLGTGATSKTYELTPYVKPEAQKEYIDETSKIISEVSNDEIKKYDAINAEAEPYFKAIETAENDLKYFNLDPEVVAPSGQGLPESVRDYYSGALDRRNAAIKKLEDSGLFKKLEDQYSIIKGLEDVNDVFFDQAEALGNMGAMTESAFYNQSEIARTHQAFARTGLEFALAFEQTGLELANLSAKYDANPFTHSLPQEAMDAIVNEMFVTPRDLFNEKMSEEFQPALEWSNLLPGQRGEFIKQTLAEGAPTLAMVMGPSFIARLGTKAFTAAAMSKISQSMLRAGATKSTIKFVQNSPRLRQKLAQKILNKASTASMGMFMATSYSGRKLQLESKFANAEKNTIKIKELLDQTPEGDVATRMELLGTLNDYENMQNMPKWRREVDAISYGLIDGFSERLGTLAIVNKARRVGKSWKNLTRGEKWGRAGKGTLKAGGAMAIEVSEEFAAQLGHNFVDKVILGENKSIFEGMDANLVASSVVNIAAMQVPSYLGNVGRVLRDEVTTIQDKRAQAKRGKRLRDLQSKLKTVKKPEDRKKLMEEVATLMQEANIAEFSSYQRFRNLSAEDIDQLIEIGGKKSKASSRYLEHMAQMPSPKNIKAMNKWQKERESLEAQLTTLRDQQGNILNTASWKRYQRYTEIMNEYRQMEKDPDVDGSDLVMKAFELDKASQEVAQDLSKDFTGKSIKQQDDVSVLPREIRNGGYQMYDAVKDLVMNYGDVVTQENTEWLNDVQDVQDFIAENNNC